MSDRLCYRCDDQGCSLCSGWCHIKECWVFICCDHDNCHKLNGTHQYRKATHD